MNNTKVGIRKRPGIYTFLCVLFFIEPIVKMIHLKIVTGFELNKLLSVIMSWNNSIQLYEYFLLMPLAALALIKIRRSSYVLLILVQVYSLVQIITFKPYSWPYFTKDPVILIWLFLIVNLAVLTYFLLPKNRKPFFDATIRWWESKTRYHASIECICQSEGIKKTCNILNISQSGAFIEGCDFKKGSIINIHFKVAKDEYNFTSQVMSIHPFNGLQGAGVKFDTSWFKILAHMKLIMRLKQNGNKALIER